VTVTETPRRSTLAPSKRRKQNLCGYVSGVPASMRLDIQQARQADAAPPSDQAATCDALLHRPVGSAVVDKPDSDRAAYNRARHALAETQRRAAIKRGVDRIAINIARLR
jgi:hypothetical protein